MTNKERNRNYLLVFLLLVISGNPAFTSQSWDKIGIVCIGLFLFFRYFTLISFPFLKDLRLYLSVFLLILAIQYFNLGFVSLPFIFGFIIKVFIGGFIFYILKDEFSKYFFNVMFFVCLISIPFFLIHLFLGKEVFSAIYLNNSWPPSIGLYSLRDESGGIFLRNSGMFWEPGAFQGYINICLFMNLKRMSVILKTERWKLIIIIITLLSTQSTTGYIVFFVLIIIYLLAYTNISKQIIWVPLSIILTFGGYAYSKYDFLGEKIESQYESALSLEGEFEPGRFGALFFDMHYIKKNPITGNGFHEKTRYADHPYLQEKKNIGHGNGFSNFVACAGILGMLWYLYIIIKFQKKYGLRDCILMCVLIIVLLQGEQFLNFPLWLGLPFFNPIATS